jgi:hypothetical protein
MCKCPSKEQPSKEQTAAGLSTTHGIKIPENISLHEKDTLQTLAKKVAELASRPIEQEKAALWTAHNDLKGTTRPLIFCDPENGWNEIITQEQILCTSPLLRVWEMHLRKEIHWAENFQDDKVIEPYFNVPFHYTDTGYGLQEEVISGGEDGSFKYKHPITDYEEHFEKLHFQEFDINYESTNKILNLAKELFGDILTVRLKGVWWWTLGMTWDFIKLRGLENLMLDTLMYPDDVHRLMGFLRDATMHKLDFFEQNGLLNSNTEGTYVGSGGFGWTSELPSSIELDRNITTMDMWGFCDSQETVGVSPESFGEFIFPYQKPIMERFGLSCYGCCEPLDLRWHVIKDTKGLRRVSVSPWADVIKMAEYLGKDFVYSRKPSPMPLANPNPDWDSIRKELGEFIQATKDCHVEIIMKDNHTLGHNPTNADTWCNIARQEIARI